jgi:hypothetical protein
MNEHDDYYEVMFLIPKTGNRFLLQNVQNEIENKHDTATFKSWGNSEHKYSTGKTWLEITIRVYIPIMKEVRDLVKQTEGENIFLYFKDVHPNLIKGWIVSVELENDEAIINFIGNSTDKTYEDYITEVANQLNAKQEVWDGKEPEYELEPAPKKKVQVYKRKLTF